MSERDWMAMESARRAWQYTGERRPPFAESPGPGQESVWDYPRPPRIEPDPRRIRVHAGSTPVADSTRALRVLETASPPSFYLPPEDVRLELLEPRLGTTLCEWKGRAVYYDVKTRGGRVVERAAWSYPAPWPGLEPIAGYLSFYPALLSCRVGGELARPQPGGYLGGWITSEITGPFKGSAGTQWW